MAEIEIGVMKGQCLARRIGDVTTLVDELAAWQAQRNADKAKIEWLFDVAAARNTFKRRYPVPTTTHDTSEAAT